jgi:tRNA threonylcarbamoyl adenosine modification protein YeaZ/ribosomal-protein-alanine acetyltransferase
MRCLALDTTTRVGSVAIVRDDEIVDQRGGDGERTFAERLPGEAIALVRAHGLALDDVDLFAVASGPGSFTGMRIGIATVQGLAFVQNRRVVGVSALEALAQIGSRDREPGTRVAAWMDAHRHDVFAALYEVTEAPLFSPERLSAIDEPTVGSPGVVLARQSTLDVAIGDGATLYGDVIARSSPGALIVAPPALAGAIGRMAIVRARRGESMNPDGIQPLYVRRPDAEVAREARLDATAPAEWRIERLTSPAEIEGVLAIENASFTNPWTREMYLSELSNQGVSYCFLARGPDGRVVGFCSFWRVFDELHINNLAVLPELRRRGVASALLTRVLAEGGKLGAARATLEVRRSNQAARLLYGRFGFTTAGVRRGYYTNPVEDALILGRERLPRE